MTPPLPQPLLDPLLSRCARFPPPRARIPTRAHTFPYTHSPTHARQFEVAVQGKTIMVDAPPGTAAAEFEALVAARTRLPLGVFALYRGGRPLRALAGRGTIELKTRGRGGGCSASKASESQDGDGVPILGQTERPRAPVTLGNITLETASTNTASKDPASPPREPMVSVQQTTPPAKGPPSAITTRPEGGHGGKLPREIYTALATFDEDLIKALRDGDIRLVGSDWFLAQPDGYRIQRRQDLEARALLTPDEAVELIQEGNRGVGSLTYGCAPARLDASWYTHALTRPVAAAQQGTPPMTPTPLASGWRSCAGRSSRRRTSRPSSGSARTPRPAPFSAFPFTPFVSLAALPRSSRSRARKSRTPPSSAPSRCFFSHPPPVRH